MALPQKKSAFVDALNESQGSIYGYIFSLLNDHHGTSDVLQETNLVLWSKIDEFREGAPFLPWALAIARFQVMAYLRDQKRRRKVLLDSDTIDLLADEAGSRASDNPQLQRALKSCIGQLAEEQRTLVKKRYFHGQKIRQLAEECGRKESAVKVQLFRIRNALRKCIQQQLQREGNA